MFIALETLGQQRKEFTALFLADAFAELRILERAVALIGSLNLDLHGVASRFEVVGEHLERLGRVSGPSVCGRGQHGHSRLLVSRRGFFESRIFHKILSRGRVIAFSQEKPGRFEGITRFRNLHGGLVVVSNFPVPPGGFLRVARFGIQVGQFAVFFVGFQLPGLLFQLLAGTHVVHHIKIFHGGQGVDVRGIHPSATAPALHNLEQAGTEVYHDVEKNEDNEQFRDELPGRCELSLHERPGVFQGPARKVPQPLDNTHAQCLPALSCFRP
ncbi:MAG: hypothetical protein ACOX5J_10625 [Candidatus Hydrogenedentales bacterium]